MKTLTIYAVVLISMLSTTAIHAQSAVKKETLKVWGNCGMCKKTIEKAAKSAGATTANWNEESHQLKVSYAVAKTSGQKIQQSVAAAGYDTQDFTADNKVYDNLHACCQYDRKDAAAVSSKEKACCNVAGCNKEEGACKDMAACKEKSCCKM